MLKSDFNGTAVSALGLGMMRLPCLDEKGACVDEKKVCTMVDFAIENGLNYFDTAWMYHGGNSEAVSGRCLNRHKRDKFLLATKFPGQLPEALENVEKLFYTQLERSNCDFFDFYLLHNVYEKNLDIYLDEDKYNIVPFLLKQKAAGKIRHLGFSCHGTVETMQKFLDRYAGSMEFCQIQLNYLDWHLQDAMSKVELLKQYDLPIWVMEPLRGGALTALDAEYQSELCQLNKEYSLHEWSFRFLQSIPEVKVVLSGMNNMEQLAENMRIFSEHKPLTGAEFDSLIALGDRLINSMGVPCTGCRYCMDNCPRHLNIPFLLAQYNEHKVSKGNWMARMMINALAESQQPGACIGCRKCSNICPQQIAIPDILHKFADELKTTK